MKQVYRCGTIPIIGPFRSPKEYYRSDQRQLGGLRAEVWNQGTCLPHLALLRKTIRWGGGQQGKGAKAGTGEKATSPVEGLIQWRQRHTATILHLVTAKEKTWEGSTRPVLPRQTPGK